MRTSEFDVVVVGAGVAGAVLARRLTELGAKVLLLEAGPGTPETLDGYETHLETFYQASVKSPGAPWPASRFAPQPDIPELRFGNGYFVQNGPDLYGSTYTRTQGGSTLHFLGVSLRMLPEDFRMKTAHGVGRDWPLSYDQLEPFYRKAEVELGVSADVADQNYLGLTFARGYDFPMQKVPLSYSDQWLESAISGLKVPMGSDEVPVRVRSYPAARNSMPRGSYRPVGALERQTSGTARGLVGERCQGNTSCTPICPVQAKYNAGRTLAQISPDRFELRSQTVASRIRVDPVSGMIQGIEYQRYAGGTCEAGVALGRAYVLAAHAVENAKLLLASGLCQGSGQVGRNLMDHPTLYAWGLAPMPIGPFRGPLSTAGIEDLRGGPFRSNHAAFRFDVGNDGWAAPVGAPEALVQDQVMHQGRFGKGLRDALSSTLPRQMRMSLAVEQLPDPDNRVSLDARFRDALGNPRPSIHYRISDYTLRGMVEASRVAAAIFQKAGIQDCTGTGVQKWFPTVQYQGTTFHYHGMGHFAGTHVMGSSASTSVVDHTQRAWEHPNLYLVGSGSFPTMGTSNPTLTLAALAVRSAEHLARELNRL